MGVDLFTIIGHTLTIDQIMSFPDLLKNDQQLKDLFLSEIESKLDHHYSREDLLSKLAEEHSWGTITKKDIIDSWTNNEDLTLVDENGYVTHMLSTYFGMLEFNRKTILVTYFPEHKYANLRHKPNRRFIIRFNRAMAKLLGQTKIICGGDSFAKKDILENMAIEGRSIESIIEFGLEKFGTPSKYLEEAIGGYFFIDDMEDPMIDYEG